jgi:hypothetical protein
MSRSGPEARTAATDHPQSVGAALGSLFRHPRHWIEVWNWKAALTSSLVRGAVFFGVNLMAGWDAARAALVTEFTLRAVTSGFYGALTQRFRLVKPRWAATLTASVLLPVVSHTVELMVHWLRHTEALAASIAASACLTIVSTAFNLHIMRHGVLTVGTGSRSLAHDLHAMPRLLATFVGLRPSRSPVAPQST